MSDFFPSGTHFYDWNTIPLVAVPCSGGWRFFNYAFDPPHEMPSMSGLQNAKEIDHEAFQALRAVQRTLASSANVEMESA